MMRTLVLFGTAMLALTSMTASPEWDPDTRR